MAGLAKRMREALSPCIVRPGRLRIHGPGNLGGCARPESPRPTQPKPPCLSSLAHRAEEVSLRHGKFSALDVSRLGARLEIPAGLAGRNPRPHRTRSDDREKPKRDGGSGIY